MGDTLGPYALGRVHKGDALECLRQLPDGCVDAVVTDPPYGLAFMGKDWDHGIPGIAFWTEAARVAKPGAHLLAFGGTRTFHRLACAIEDAGWEIRDCLSWLYGQGFPKSLDVSKAIDRAAGAEREVVGSRRLTGTARIKGGQGGATSGHAEDLYATHEIRDVLALTAPATPAASQWSGWGTALKPAHEVIIAAQKPLDVAAWCVTLAHKIGGLVCQLPSSAKRAAERSPSSQSGPAAVFDSALCAAVERCSTPGDSFALMGTSQSWSETPTSLSIVWSWLITLADLWAVAKMFTTETESATITDLRTLNCLLSRITADDITGAAIFGPGTGSSVWLADGTFCGVAARVVATRDPSVAASATSSVGGRVLRPNWSGIILARKPLDGTVAANVQAHGTGAINVDGCRVSSDGYTHGGQNRSVAFGASGLADKQPRCDGASGRFPANLVLDEEAAAMLDEAPGEHPSGRLETHHRRSGKNAIGTFRMRDRTGEPCDFGGDTGGPSRFFYTAKATRAERDEGGALRTVRDEGGAQHTKGVRLAINDHPTVKPRDLMRWLCRLVTPPGGIILDPFSGSGTTGCAARLEGFRFIGFEQDAHYCEIANARIAATSERLGEVRPADATTGQQAGLFAEMEAKP